MPQIGEERPTWNSGWLHTLIEQYLTKYPRARGVRPIQVENLRARLREALEGHEVEDR